MDNANQNNNIKISPKDFILRYLKYLPLFLLSLAVCIIIGNIYLRYAQPVYNAKAVLLIKSENGSSGVDKEFESMFSFKGKNNIRNEIEILKSLTLSKRVVKKLGLQTKYYAIGNVKTSLMYPESPISLKIAKINDTTSGIGFVFKITSNGRIIINGDNTKTYQFGQYFENSSGVFQIIKNDGFFKKASHKEYKITWEPLQNAAGAIQGSLKVTPADDRADILNLSCETIQPDLGRDILDRIMEEYKNSNIENRTQTSLKTVAFINERLSLVTSELGDVEQNLQQFKQKNKLFNIDAQSDIYINSQSDMDKEIAEKEINLNIVRYLQEYVSDKKNEYTIVPSTLGIEEPTLLQFVKSYNELQLLRERELKTTTTENFLVKDIESQLKRLREDIQENLKNIYASGKMSVDNLQKKYLTANQRIVGIPLQQKELLEITRQQGIKQSLYLYLLQKREETAISLASTISNSQVVDAATSSNFPFKPNRSTIKLLAIFLGFLLPAIFIYLRELLNDKIRNRNDIQKYTSTPIFGEIGHSDDSDVLVVSKNSRNVISEQFRVIRANLQYLVGKNKNSVILVTSTSSGEGKTFISINLGSVMALAGKKTVILEFDIRKPKIVSGLKLKKTEGFTNFIVSGSDVKNLPVAFPEVENLFIIPCGPIPPNPAELLIDERINELFDYLKKEFEVIIIDTAPIGLVSDAQTLSKFADCTIHIVRLNYTLKKQIHFIDNLYTHNKMPKMALLINDIKASSDYYSYGSSYGGYGYGYGYKTYYGDTKKRSSKKAGFLNKLFGRTHEKG